jgi:hypothetical protein
MLSSHLRVDPPAPPPTRFVPLRFSCQNVVSLSQVPHARCMFTLFNNIASSVRIVYRPVLTSLSSLCSRTPLTTDKVQAWRWSGWRHSRATEPNADRRVEITALFQYACFANASFADLHNSLSFISDKHNVTFWKHVVANLIILI